MGLDVKNERLQILQGVLVSINFILQDIFKHHLFFDYLISSKLEIEKNMPCVAITSLFLYFLN